MTEQHGPAIPVVPQSPAKMYRKAAATFLMTIGFGAAALLPHIHEMKWLPAWVPGVIGIVGGMWQGFKQARDGQNLEEVNMSQPAETPTMPPSEAVQPRQDLRQSIPPVADQDSINEQ